MSASSSILNTIREVPTTDTLQSSEHQIVLIDQERGQEDRNNDEDAERNASEAPTAPETPKSPLRKTLTSNSSYLQQSLKRQWTKRKYAKYDRDRYDVNDDDDDNNDAADEDPANKPQIGETATAAQTSYLERSRAKAKNILLRRKRTLGTAKHDQDSVIDILYENQRGVFLFGIPKYSSSSLLPNDPAPWQNHQFRTSPVDIRNAQVPDPSWEWGWKSWYVDMSRDVDEEGWEYSFKFTGGFAWHGNHPWFHSFVRRRRWLRLRRRRDMHHHTKEKSHELTEEYFTIHPKTLRPVSLAGSSMEVERLREKLEEEEELKDAEKTDITDIGSLIHIMRRSGVDREKQVAVRKFVDAGGEELFYLADRMEEIMNLFIYQSSRRQLLSYLLQRFDQAYTRRQSLTEHQHDNEDAQREHDKAAQQAENLMNAVKAADEQVKKLEFWSDIKDMSRKGETLQAEGSWSFEKWQGLSPTTTKGMSGEEAFASKQAASEGAPELHRHPEHPERPSILSTGSGKGKQKENVGRSQGVDDEDGDSKSAVTARSKKSSMTTGSRVLAVKHPTGAGKESSASEAEGYYTPAESASELPMTRQKLKEGNKSRMSNLDGVLESDGDEDDKENLMPMDTSSAQPNIPSRTQATKQSVQIVEPVPEPSDDRQAGGRGGGGDGS